MRYLIALIFIMAAITPAGAADPFDPPFGGSWKCPDGSTRRVVAVDGVSPVGVLHAAVAVACIPREFRTGTPWWEACMAGRTDCVHSNTAYLGLDKSQPLPHAKRGPGYCYTGQPYTCSPDGRLP